jgi:hypothetical protein
MIKDYFVIMASIIFRPFLPLFLRRLSGVIHVAYIKLGGLSKFVDDLCIQRDYNLITDVKGFLILYIKGVPFFLGRSYKVSTLQCLNDINCIYHVHQLSHNQHKDWLFLQDKTYIVTIHDYYCVCERFFLLDYNFNYCHLNEECCKDLDRREWISRILLNASCVIVPDESMIDILSHFYKVDYTVIPHGI